jgi:hypothetical protein
MKSTPTSSFFAEPLIRRADDLAVRHSKEGASSSPLPIVAAQSPIHELIIDEVAASIPPEVAKKLRASRTVAQAHDWIAAGAMFSWIRTNRTLGQQYLEELGDCPQEASLALAKTVARTLEPPPPDPRAPTLDRRGLVLQGLFGCLILVGRGLFLAFLLTFATGGMWSQGTLGFLERAIVLPDLLWLNDPAKSTTTIFSLLCGSEWLFLECLYVPRWLEFCRRLPLRRMPVRVYTHWRVDSLLVFWSAHAVLLQVILTGKAIQLMVQFRQILGINPVSAVVIWIFAVIAFLQVIVAVWQLRSIR